MNRLVNLALFPSFVLLAVGSASAEAPPDCAAFNSAAFFATATPEDVAECLEQGADPLSDTAHENSPLFHAVRNATSPLVLDVLLDEALERDQLEEVLNQPGRLGRSVMHFAAAEARDPAMITWLSGWGSDRQAKYDCTDSWWPNCTEPIHLATYRADGFLFAATLLALGADGAVPNCSGRTIASRPRHGTLRRWNNIALLRVEEWAETARLRSFATADPNAACDSFLTPDFFASASLGEVA